MIKSPNLHINRAIYQYLNTLGLGGERGKGALFLKKSIKQSRPDNIRWILATRGGVAFCEHRALWKLWLSNFAQQREAVETSTNLLPSLIVYLVCF